MELASFFFIIFLMVSAIIYYVLPTKIRWVGILFSNAFYLYFINTKKQLIIWCAMSVFAYLTALLISTVKAKSGKCAITVLSVLALGATLVILRDSAFFKLPKFDLAPTGISYFTLSWIAYILHVYWERCEAQKNPVKFMAYAGFFPLLSSGPIVSYADVGENITTGNKISYTNIVNGFARIAWGFMKKIIIADRIAAFVDTVYANPYGHPGLYFLVANTFFVIQLYADFSGCIDIALGSAEVFGIKLPENFDLPFMSQTLEEFWRRWHITLGGWLRDFILYPILKSAPWQKLGDISKKIFGKKTGKKIPVWCGLIISWFLIGFWHGGGWNYIFGVGLFFGFIIILSQMLSPLFEKIVKLLHINTDALSWKAFRIVRTWIIFGTGLSFFRANSILDGFRNMKIAFSVFNPWIFFTGELYEQGIDRVEFNILVFFLAIMAIGGIVKYITKKSLREIMNEQNLVFRIAVYALLVVSVIIFGSYGDGFNSLAFIYQGF